MALSLLLGAPKRHKEDPNTLGFSEYQRGNYAKAIPLLRKAVQLTPKNAYAWFNLGRATAAGGQGTTTENECDNERAWKYVAMAAFNRALSLDREDILSKLKQPDPKFALFRDTAEYKKWFQAQGPIPKSDADLTAFFAETNSWFLPVGDTVFMDFEPGGTLQRYGPTDDDHGEAEGHWRIRKGGLEITLNDAKPQRYGLFRGPYTWQLKGPEGHWEPGPILRDCAPKK